MSIVELSSNQLNEIESLWVELNSLHGELSVDFKNHFALATFSKRIEKLNVKDELVVFSSKIDGEAIGYCIASIENGRGELDSLYVKPNHRGRNIGKDLVTSAMTWFEKQNCAEIDIQVAQGNEAVLSFYEKFGFKKRFHVLQIKNHTSSKT